MKFTTNLAIIGFVFCLVASFGCNQMNRAKHRESLLRVTDSVGIYYSLSEPDDKFFLPYALAEISGLSFKPPGTLLAVQDEDGILYELDFENKKVVESIKFESPGDFEGVELVGDTVFIIESDGDIRLFSLSNQSKTQKISTPLESKNDTEGLGYDPARNILLIACKDEAGINKKIKGKAVYAFDLATMTLRENPHFTITQKDMEDFYEHHREFDYEAARFQFQPSGIAYNSSDGYYYILAHLGKILLVVNPEGRIVASYSIPGALLGQPEGICFSPAGDLYLASEGEGDKGYILKYSIRRK